LFTKELLEDCIRSNDSTSAKIKTLHVRCLSCALGGKQRGFTFTQRFGAVLNEEASKEFPVEYEQYLRLRQARKLAAAAASSMQTQ